MENMLTWGYKNEIWEVNSKGLAFSVPKPGEPKNELLYSVLPNLYLAQRYYHMVWCWQ